MKALRLSRSMILILLLGRIRYFGRFMQISLVAAIQLFSNAAIASESPSAVIHLKSLFWENGAPTTIATIISVATLGLMIVGHALGYIQFIIRLQHEVSLKRRETHASYQKEIYLKAAAAISEDLSMLMKIINFDSNDLVNQSGSNKLGPIANQISLIGSNSTIEALANFSSQYLETLFGLYAKIFLTQKDRDRVIELGRDIEENLKNQSHQVAYLRDIYGKYSFESEIVVREQAVFAGMQIQFKKMHEERLRMNDLNVEHLLERLNFVIDEFEKLTQLLIVVNVEIRREIEFSFSEEQYRQSILSSHDRSKKSLERFIQELKSSLHR